MARRSKIVRPTPAEQQIIDARLKEMYPGVYGLIPSIPTIVTPDVPIGKPSVSPIPEKNWVKQLGERVRATLVKPKAKVKIDLDKISKIESGNNPQAENIRSGARGLHQIMSPTWKEMVSKMKKDWSWDDAFDAKKNTEIAGYYMNTEIPRLLKHYGITDTVKNRLIAYNWGVGNLNKTIKKYGANYLDHLPKETSNYIKKYSGKKNKIVNRGPAVIHLTDRKK